MPTILTIKLKYLKQGSLLLKVEQDNNLVDTNLLVPVLFCFVSFMWWAGNCSITESLPELIQQVRQDLAGAPGGQP